MSTNNEDPCGICGDNPKAHEAENVKHAWVPEGGQLISKEEARKAQARPAMMRTAQFSDPSVINRLVELMLDKGIFTSEEGLYIAGIGAKPATQRFRDPRN